MKQIFAKPVFAGIFAISSAVGAFAEEGQSLRDEWIGEYLDLLNAFKCVATEAGQYADEKYAGYDQAFAETVEPLGEYSTSSMYVFGLNGYVEHFADFHDPQIMTDYSAGVMPQVVDRYLNRLEVSVVKALKEQTPKYLDSVNAAITEIEDNLETISFGDVVEISDNQVDAFQGNYNYYAVNAARYTGIDYGQTFKDCRPESFKP